MKTAAYRTLEWMAIKHERYMKELEWIEESRRKSSVYSRGAFIR